MKFFLITLFALPLTAAPPVVYQLSFPNAAHHEMEVKATFPATELKTFEVQISRSSPGRYALHEFGKNVYGLQASTPEGSALPLAQVAPARWRISPRHGEAFVLRYTVFGDRVDGTYDAVDETHAHLNMPATLIWAQTFAQSPAALRFDLPAGRNWKIATQLKEQSDGTWTAPNLDRLMDSPVELSAHDDISWNVANRQFRLALHQRGSRAEADAFGMMCKAVVAEEEGVFGSFPEYDGGAYTFLLDLLPYASGDGMEHRDSTVISGPLTLRENPSRALGVVAHEFFHSWNVKRIRPRSLEPFNYSEASMSGELWFAEGFTNYYGPLSLRRARLSSMNDFTHAMGQAVNYVLNAGGRNVFNVIGMSERAPYVDAATANDPVNTANTYISYYFYGQAIALGIDLSLRERFPGKSLDDWMRAMYREHPDITKPYTLKDLEKSLGEVTDSAWAADIFQRHIYGKEPFDYRALLAHVGLQLAAENPGAAWLGAPKIEINDHGVKITGPALRDASLYNAGLDLGDTIFTWGGKKIADQKSLDDWLKTHKPGDRIPLSVEKRSGKTDVEMTLTGDPRLKIVTFEQAGITLDETASKARDRWLQSKAIHIFPAPRKFCPLCHRELPAEFEYCPDDGRALQITKPLKSE